MGIFEIDVDKKGVKIIKKIVACNGKNDFFHKLIGCIYREKLRNKFNCIWHRKCTIGKNLYVAHPCSIVLGPTTVIGDNCSIYPGIAVISKANSDSIKKPRRHAKVGDNVVIGYGATLIGDITIGNNVRIGARAIVTKDVPDNSIVVNVNEIKNNTTHNGIPPYVSVEKIVNYDPSSIDFEE